MPTLTLLDEPAWDGSPIGGERSIVLLACLHLAGDQGATVDRLIDELWPDAVPANASKALHVVVSRTRKATGPDSVERLPHGYRLGRCVVDADEVDAWSRAAAEALREGDAMRAARDASRAAEVPVRDDAGVGPLARVRDRARARQRDARRTRALALARSGSAPDAYPALVAAHEDDPGDDVVLAALLLAEAEVRGHAAALERYEGYRADVAERLGVDPSDALRRVHVQLLASDHPSRDGVRYDADDLVGRDDDLGALLGLLSQHRVVTVLGPGGLGKTRMAHLVARHAPQPVVHLVELVGVRSGDDVVGEVGSTLGVRDSVTSLGSLTPKQRSDLRARIAASLDRAPALLVVDNCEHVVDAVADLVAFLVASTRDLRVLTTSRSPLAIAAERVYPLAQLGQRDAEDLFRLRAVAVRPAVVLDDAEVAEVVTRLDGLPLAIELAAAKVRVMSVAEIARRLDNRFELLRGGDRSAPDRHRTLLAVIDWSWTLLEEPQRRALRRLSVFSDGLTLDAAEAVVGDGAVDAVEALVDQSLLAVTESESGLRYRMLETVREFGRMHLVDSGDDADAEQARRRWALEFVSSSQAALFSQDQPQEVARLLTEEVNLSDVLRTSLVVNDIDAVVAVMGVLALLWTIRGEHARVMMLAPSVDEALAGYRPPPAREEQARLTATMVATSGLVIGADRTEGSRALLAEMGPGRDPMVAAMVRIMPVLADRDRERAQARLVDLTTDPDRLTRSVALRWSALQHENAGDPLTASLQIADALELWRPEDGVWTRAMLRMTLSQLEAQRGDVVGGARHAELALPDLLSLQATDDAIDARSVIALAALREGDLRTAEALVAVNAAGADGPWIFGGLVVNLSVRAEIELARGEVDRGLATYREMALAMQRSMPGIPSESGVEPWTLYGLATATAAHALHGTGADLYDELVVRLPAVLDVERLNYPVLGVVLFASGLAGLEHGRIDVDLATRMLALAERFGYVRLSPSMAWQHAVDAVGRHGDDAALARVARGFGDRRGAQLLDEARAVVEQLGS